MLDPGQGDQLLTNLVANARDAMPDGGSLNISTQHRQLDAAWCEQHVEARSGAFVALSVCDTGTGMDTATQEMIFEPFFTTKDADKGTGLGLATVHGIVSQHQGFILVETAPGAGTCFRIFLPLVKS